MREPEALDGPDSTPARRPAGSPASAGRAQRADQLEAPLGPAELELIGALGQLELAAVRTLPEQLWYRAGLEAGHRRARAWQAVAALVAVALGGTALRSVARPPATVTVDRIVYVPQPVVQPAPSMASAASAASDEAPARAAASASSGEYRRFRDSLVELGKDAPPLTPLGGGWAVVRPEPSRWPLSPVDELPDPKYRTHHNKKG